MTGQLGEREISNDVLQVLAHEFPAELGVTQGRMFNGQGLKADGKFFAFVNRIGHLVIKLPESEVRRLIDDGEAEPVKMGKRTMREWVSLPQPPNDDYAGWRVLLERARAFTVHRDQSA